MGGPLVRAHGDATVFFTRMLPIIRTFISLPAGVARMPFWRFTVLTLAGCVPWVFMLTFIGKQAGDNWEDWKDSLHYVDSPPADHGHDRWGGRTAFHDRPDRPVESPAWRPA